MKHGFAGNSGLPQTWIFFADLEPAVVFGRSARMSVSGPCVYRILAWDTIEMSALRITD